MTEMVQDKTGWENRVKGASRFADGSAIIRPQELDWTDGPLEGLTFRLTNIDRQTGTWSAFLKAGPNTTIPAHFVYGQVQHYVRQGSFTFDGRTLQAEDYYLDAGGLATERKIGSEGLLEYVTFDGGISNIDSDGNPVGGYIDCNKMYQLAKANGAADHLPPPGR